ncbi:50S ribosomal protein L11 methyltransferase [bacterium]|nr:50S ribosomal protein L11 methyltransferase [bacterium]
MSETAADWPGFEVAGPPELLDGAAEIVAATLADGVLLGTSRETWHESRYLQELRGRSGSGSEDPRDHVLRIYLARDADLGACGGLLADELSQVFPEAWDKGLLRVRPIVIPQADWATEWRQFFTPIAVGDRLLVLPSWWDAQAALRDLAKTAEDTLIIRIEPGCAFGSGTHPTTRLCLGMLEGNLPNAARVLDFGAGSGVLSFACAALGASAVVGIEIDPDALGNFENNRELNADGVPVDRIAYRIGSSDVLGADEVFDLIVCNALFDRVSSHLPTLLEHLAPEGVFLYSGFLGEDGPVVVKHLKGLRLEPLDLASLEEWAGIATRRLLV